MQQPPEFHFKLPFDYRVRNLGLLGVHANAFLAGAYDAIDLGNRWYDHPCLVEWHCQFRHEKSMSLAAEWAAEWLALLRMEGADSLRMHWQTYEGFQQHYVLPDMSRGVVFSAWKRDASGHACVSSWTFGLEPSRAREMYRQQALGFEFPVGIPGTQCVDLLIETSRILDDVSPNAPDPAALRAKLDALYAKGKAAGYVPPSLPADSTSRIAQAAAHFIHHAPVDGYDPYPCFPNDAQAGAARQVLIDAGLFCGLLDQVRQRIPLHPYDQSGSDFYPWTDPEGKVYRALETGLQSLGLDWLRLCFKSWRADFSQAPDERLNLRVPGDLAFIETGTGRDGFSAVDWLRSERSE